MHVEILESPESGTIAREDASGGEFYLRADGSVWYRNTLAADGDYFANASQPDFLRSVEALHRYNTDVAEAESEEQQMFFVQRLADELRIAVASSEPAESFWELIVEQAGHGML